MAHNTENCADVRERLRTYAQALDLDCGNDCIEAISANVSTLFDSLKLLRKQLAADFGGDFLAFRLRQGFAANEADFRPPPLERQPLPPAPLAHGTLPAMD
ncbi:MAG: hypothetical protein ACRESA_00285 [Gammaproteobacteria bacterium]